MTLYFLHFIKFPTPYTSCLTGVIDSMNVSFLQGNECYVSGWGYTRKTSEVTGISPKILQEINGGLITASLSIISRFRLLLFVS